MAWSAMFNELIGSMPTHVLTMSSISASTAGVKSVASVSKHWEDISVKARHIALNKQMVCENFPMCLRRRSSSITQTSWALYKPSNGV